MPDLPTLIEAAVKNGISLVVCLTIIFIFAKILQWVFKFVDKLTTESMTRLTTEVAKLAETIQKLNESNALMLQRISQELKDGFEQMSTTARFQREEHEKMLQKMEASERRSEEVRERLLKEIGKNECRIEKK